MDGRKLTCNSGALHYHLETQHSGGPITLNQYDPISLFMAGADTPWRYILITVNNASDNDIYVAISHEWDFVGGTQTTSAWSKLGPRASDQWHRSKDFGYLLLFSVEEDGRDTNPTDSYYVPGDAVVDIIAYDAVFIGDTELESLTPTFLEPVPDPREPDFRQG
jgi:hypothetical protein